MSDLLDLLEYESKEIELLFNKASIEGKGTPQEVADRRETVVKKFLEKYFPFPFRIAKGNIIDSHNHRSASIDCLVLNPNHPYTVSDDEKYSVILADGVDFAIEVKPDLSNVNEIERSLHQIKTVKQLTRVNNGTILQKKLTAEEQLTSRKIQSFIFSHKTYVNIRTLIEKIVIYYETNKIPRIEQFDCIIINGKGLLFNSKKDSYFNLSTTEEGLFYAEYEHKTIMTFLFWLNKLVLSSPKISESVLIHYLKFDGNNMTTYRDLNLRLNSIT